MFRLRISDPFLLDNCLRKLVPKHIVSVTNLSNVVPHPFQKPFQPNS